MARFITGLFLLLSVWVVNAQATPEDLFIDGLEVERVEGETPFATRETLSVIDTETRTLYVRNFPGALWQQFDYPEGFETVECLSRRTNATWIVRSSCDPDTSEARILNPNSGQYTEPETVCWSHIKALPAEGQWVVVTDPEIRAAVLCFTEDNNIRHVLPPEFRWIDITTSPDKQWVVTMGLREFERDPSVYVYNTVEDKMVKLGIVDATVLDPEMSFGQWVSSTRGTILERDRYRTWPQQNLFGFDVTEQSGQIALTDEVVVDKFDLALSGWPQTVNFNLRPARYESVITGAQIRAASTPASHVPCQIMIYDETGTQTYQWGYECLPVAVTEGTEVTYSSAYRIGSDYYYLATRGAASVTSTLNTFNADTRDGGYLGLTGEIETILGVSPDKRYIVVLLDDDGKLNLSYECELCRVSQGMTAAIFDTQTSRIVYASERIGVYEGWQVVWPNEYTVVFYALPIIPDLNVTQEGENTQFPGSLRSIGLTTDGHMQVLSDSTLPLLGEFHPRRISEDKRYWLTKRGVFDLVYFTHIDLVRSDLPSGVQVDLYWYDAQTVQALVQGADRAEYLIRIPS